MCMIVAMSVSQQIQTLNGAPMTSTLTCTRESNTHKMYASVYLWFTFMVYVPSLAGVVCVMFGAEVLQYVFLKV